MLRQRQVLEAIPTPQEGLAGAVDVCLQVLLAVLPHLLLLLHPVHLASSDYRVPKRYL